MLLLRCFVYCTANTTILHRRASNPPAWTLGPFRGLPSQSFFNKKILIPMNVEMNGTTLPKSRPHYFATPLSFIHWRWGASTRLRRKQLHLAKSHFIILITFTRYSDFAASKTQKGPVPPLQTYNNGNGSRYSVCIVFVEVKFFGDKQLREHTFITP